MVDKYKLFTIHNVFVPSISILLPLRSLAIRMKNQRPPNTSEVEVKVSKLVRGKGKIVSWMKLDHYTQLMVHNLPSFPFTKWHDNTNSAVTAVSVSCSGYRDVDDNTRKWS